MRLKVYSTIFIVFVIGVAIFFHREDPHHLDQRFACKINVDDIKNVIIYDTEAISSLSKATNYKYSQSLFKEWVGNLYLSNEGFLNKPFWKGGSILELNFSDGTQRYFLKSCYGAWIIDLDSREIFTTKFETEEQKKVFFDNYLKEEQVINKLFISKRKRE